MPLDLQLQKFWILMRLDEKTPDESNLKLRKRVEEQIEEDRMNKENLNSVTGKGKSDFYLGFLLFIGRGT